jgi:hypothetical protein
MTVATRGALSDTETSTITVVAGPVIDLNSTAPVVSVATTTSNLVVNGTFGTGTGAAPPAPWVEGSTSAAGAVVNVADPRFHWTDFPVLHQP